MKNEIFIPRTSFLMLFLLLACQVWAQPGGKRLNLSFKNEALSSALKEIENASDYKVLFSYETVKDYRVTVTVTHATAPQAVEKVIQGLPLTATVKGNFITVARKRTSHGTGKNGQLRRVHGTVSDERQEPLIGASVTVPGSPFGTITDMNGRFDLSLPEEIAAVKVSYIGMVSQEVKVGGEKPLQIVLVEDNNVLSDVVVTGYQTLSKERATGSFAKVTAQELESKRLSNLSTLLEGEVAGYTDGTVRGITSMMGETSPLYVIDGFPVENQVMDSQGNITTQLPDLNMEDIESITVLKDAAAASIYGARAANGVIVITTKSGSGSGKLDVGFSATLTWSPYHYSTDHLASSADLIALEKEWAALNPSLQGEGAAVYAQRCLDNAFYPNAGINAILNYYAGHLTEAQMNSRLESLATKGFNYYKQMEKYAKRDPLYQQYNLNLTRTVGKNSFKVSVTYKNNQLEDKYSKNQSLGVNLRNITRLTRWLDLETGAYMQFAEEDSQSSSVLSPGYTVLPYDDLKNADGTNYTRTADLLYTATKQQAISDYGLYSLDITPLDELDKGIGNTNTLSLRTFARMNVQLFPFLKYTASFQYERGSNKYKQIMEAESYSTRNTVDTYASVSNGAVTYHIPYGDILNQRDQYRKSYNFRQQLNFDLTVGGLHDITAILGTETRENKVEMHRSAFYGYDEQRLSYTAVNEAALSSGFSNAWGSWASFYQSFSDFYESKNRYFSIYGNAAYTYDGKYSVTASMRWDRSNLWGTSSKYQNKPIWSAGASWLVSREKFMEHLNWLDLLKVRFSYGITGNVNPEYSPYMVIYYNNNYNVGGNYTYVSSRPNSQLSWEKTTVTNIGLDFALFKNRLRGTLEYYNKQGENLLASTMGVPTEGYGYSTYALNNGGMRNRGFEISLSGEVIRTRDFSWTANAIFSTNQNKVTYVNVKAPVYYLALDYSTAYPTIGDPYGGLYGYEWAGLSAEGLPQVCNENGEIVTDQPTTLEAIKLLGNATPTYSGSFGSTLKYKDFDLSFLFVYQGNYKMRNANMPFLGYAYASGVGYISQISGLGSQIADRWQQPGDEAYTSVPRACFSEAGYNLSGLYSTYYYSSANLLDASHIRLSNISLAYHLPVAFCRKFSCRNARVQVNVENPFMWAKSKQAKYQLGGCVSPNYVLGIYLNF